MSRLGSDICFISAGVYEYLDHERETPRGGAQRQQYMLGCELRDRGYSVSFLVGDYGQQKFRIIDDMSVVRGCPERIPSLVSLPKTFVEFWNAMREINADLYYVRGAPRLSIATALGCELVRKPFVFCVANDADLVPKRLNDRYGPAVRWGYRWMLQSADVVIAQTERQHSLLETEYNKGSIQIPNGYPLPQKDQLLPQEHREYVLWIGSSDPDQKRPGRYIDLAEQLPEIDFVMISKPTSDVEFHKRLREKATPIKNLRFAGSVAPDEVHDYYRRAQLVVNTSVYEGFPNTFLESWRYETPVISFSFDLDGLLKSEVGGMLSGSMHKLRADVQNVVKDIDKRSELGSSGRQLLKDRYSLETATDQYESVIKQYKRMV